MWYGFLLDGDLRADAAQGTGTRRGPLPVESWLRFTDLGTTGSRAVSLLVALLVALGVILGM